MEKRVCAVPDCNKKLSTAIVCKKHYGQGYDVDTGKRRLDSKGKERFVCMTDGCNNLAKKKGKCKSHQKESIVFCTFEDCENKAVKRNLCTKHLGYTIRIKETGKIKTDKKGNERIVCKQEGCANVAKTAKGLCSKHAGYVKGTQKSVPKSTGKNKLDRSGKEKPVCIIQGCTLFVYSSQKCYKHFGRKITMCSFDGCDNKARKDFLCFRHNTEEYQKNSWKKQHSTPQYRLKRNLRSRMKRVLKNNRKVDTTIRLIGCSVNELKKHLESLFTEGMTWDNYGKYDPEVKRWQIDHIRPCASFDLLDPEEQRRCFHYTNLQPLWAKENMKKGSKYNF